MKVVPNEKNHGMEYGVLLAVHDVDVNGCVKG